MRFQIREIEIEDYEKESALVLPQEIHTAVEKLVKRTKREYRSRPYDYVLSKTTSDETDDEYGFTYDCLERVPRATALNRRHLKDMSWLENYTGRYYTGGYQTFESFLRREIETILNNHDEPLGTLHNGVDSEYFREIVQDLLETHVLRLFYVSEEAMAEATQEELAVA